jgi:hypothetical protein
MTMLQNKIILNKSVDCSVIEQFPSMHETLKPVPSTAKNKAKTNNDKKKPLQRTEFTNWGSPA